jgi:hypothetical protein
MEIKMAKYINDFRQGDTVKIKLEYGSTIDLTGYKYTFILKSDLALADEDAELNFTTTAGDYTSDDETHGVVFIVVPSATTEAVPTNKYYYGLKELSSTLEERTILPTPEDYKDKLFVAPIIVA